MHGLTNVRCAALLGVTPRTVSAWESGRVRVPYAPYRLLRVLLGAELPGLGWEGFRSRVIASSRQRATSSPGATSHGGR